MATTQAGIYNSGNFPDIKDSIKHSYDNLLLVCNTSRRINYAGKFIMEEPVNFFHSRRRILTNSLYDFSISTRGQYKPELISEMLYGTPDLWYVIMMVNGFTYPTQLKPPSIKVASPAAVNRVLDGVIKYRARYQETRERPINISKRFVKDLGIS